MRSVLQGVHRGGITAVNATIAAWDDTHQTILRISKALHMLEQNADLVMPVRSVEDIHRAKAAKKVGVIFGFQRVAFALPPTRGADYPAHL
jgi:membrane dipeptidase